MDLDLSNGDKPPSGIALIFSLIFFHIVSIINPLGIIIKHLNFSFCSLDNIGILRSLMSNSRLNILL